MDNYELTYAIRGAIFEVSNILGPGFLEKIYENALVIELRLLGMKAESQVPLRVSYRDNLVGEFFADILVENRAIIELKTADCFLISNSCSLAP